MAKKILNCVIGMIGIAGIADVIDTVRSQHMILTALPLWMRLSAVVAVWGIMLAISFIAYRFLDHHLHSVGPQKQ